MKLTIFAALLMMSLTAFAEGENPGSNVTGPDCEGAVADSSGSGKETGSTTVKPATDPTANEQ